MGSFLSMALTGNEGTAARDKAPCLHSLLPCAVLVFGLTVFHVLQI